MTLIGHQRMLIFLLAMGGLVRAQMNQFIGGNNKLHYRGAFSYEGASALGEMADISTLYSATGSVFGNPAGIIKVNRLHIQADVSLPGLGINTSSRNSEAFRHMIQKGVDGFLIQEDVKGQNRVDPVLRTDMAQSPGLEGLGIVCRTNFFIWPVAIAGAFERLADFQFDLEMNDVIVGVGLPLDESNPASDSIKAKFNGQTDLSFQLGLNRRGAAIGMQVPHSNLKIGFSAYQYMGYFNCSAAGEINGFISRGQRESYFNLKSSPYTDDLSLDYLGSGRGSAAGFGIGLNWMPLTHFGIDLAANWNGIIRQGGLYGEHYIPNAMDNDDKNTNTDEKKTGPKNDGKPKDEGDFFQISKLNLTKLTLTKKVTNEFSNVSLKLPARLGASFCIDYKQFKLNLDYAWYYKDMVLSYFHTSTKTVFDPHSNDVIQKADGTDSVEVNTGSGKLGSHLTHKAALGLYLWGFFLNAGTYIGNPSIFYANDMEIDIRFMPIFNVGYSFRPRSRITADFSLIQLPMTVFKTTLKYKI